MAEEMINRKKIHELPKQMADKIAAGEVVDRPLSIVKELLENAIDAGAGFITAEIKNGGKSYIRITDNGCGIPADETELAFRRHATSKLQEPKDLDAIETLGFRGEALASIAAVSRVELITKTPEAEAGASLQIEGGKVVSASAAGCPEGTTIIVRDLFYNTPARLKFLKKDHVESGLIIDFVSKLALAYPGIRMRLINNGNTLFSTPGKGDMFRTIATIYDPAMAGRLIPFSVSADGISAQGYLSAPDETRANRKNQIFFVNGRYVQSKVLEQSVSDGYREKLFEGRYPIVFLFLQLPPEQLDVNIHPNKKEIRFDNESAVRELVTQGIRNALKVPEALPEITFKKDRPKGKPESSAEKSSSGISPGLTASQAGEEISPLPQAKQKEQLPSEGKEHQQQEKMDLRALLRQKRAEEQPEPYRVSEKKEQQRFQPICIPAQQHPFEVAAIRPVGTIFASYILGCDEDCFYMIDQHAAHERVFYEQLTKSFYSQQNASQLMAVPISVTVSHAVKESEGVWIGFLNRIGFSVEEFGPKAYAIKAIPAYMTDTEAQRFIADFFDRLEEPGAFRDVQRTNRIITRSCKSAVKANDRLSPAEIDRLLRDLANCENPFSCPHGRPTIIRMKKSEIEALFKR